MTVRIADLWAEHRRDSPFVAVARPRLSWTIAGAEEPWPVSRAEYRLDGARVVARDGSDHLLVDWPFEDLVSEDRHRVAVRVQSESGEWTRWSRERELALGFPLSWAASFIGLPSPPTTAQPFIARRVIPIRGEVHTATLYLTALGAVRVFMDGDSVDDAVLSPGWTSYQERVLLDPIDVTAHVRGDRLVMTAEATGAWFTEAYGFDGEERRVYGEQPAIAAQLVLTFADGSQDVIVTDRDWEVRDDGPIVASGLYAGETVDARRRRAWSTVETGWTPPLVLQNPPRVVPRSSEPVRVVERIRPVSVTPTRRGSVILDFGQNFAGRLRLTVSGPAGHEVSVRHAEVLEGDELAIRPLRRAAAHDRFILGGTGSEVFEPFGTFHGFRYAEITGWPGGFDEDAVAAVVLSSDMRRTGWFESSDPLLDRLHENVVWSTRSNFLSIPTDCPQRDERMGWTGDVAVFAPTAAALFDTTSFLSSWLADLEIEQVRHDGVVPFVVPDIMGFPPGPAAGWGDAATLVPAALWQASGDLAVLRRQWDSMHAWVRTVWDLIGESGLWEGSTQFGDWLDPAAPPDNAGASRADRDLVANAFFYRSVRLLADAAERLGSSDEALVWTSRADLIRSAFVEAYVTSGGRVVSDAPTAYVLALHFGLIEGDELRARAVERLVVCIRRDAYHIGTGFLGTPYLLDALVDGGRTDVAEALLLQTGNPSWLYPLTQGATTVWERWDSLLEDGSINPGEMTSFNHYAFGAVASFMHRRLAGVSPHSAGYGQILFAPAPFDRLDHARVGFDTPSGRVSGGWHRRGDDIVYVLSVPSQARALVRIPGGSEAEVGPGEHEWVRPSHTQPARPHTARLSVFSPLRSIADDERAFAAVMAALEGYGDAARVFRRRTDWSARSPLVAQLWALPQDAFGRIAGALNALS